MHRSELPQASKHRMSEHARRLRSPDRSADGPQKVNEITLLRATHIYYARSRRTIYLPLATGHVCCNETVFAGHGLQRSLAAIARGEFLSRVACFHREDLCNGPQETDIPASRRGETLEARLHEVQVSQGVLDASKGAAVLQNLTLTCLEHVLALRGETEVLQHGVFLFEQAIVLLLEKRAIVERIPARGSDDVRNCPVFRRAPSTTSPRVFLNTAW